MIRVLIGMPGGLSAWAFALVEALSKRRPGFLKRLIDRNDLIDRLDDPGPDRTLLVLSQYPNPSLADALRSAVVPVAILAVDPREGVQFIRSVHQVPFAQALRTVSASMATIATLLDRVALPVLSRNPKMSSRDFAARLAETLDLAARATDLDAALAALGTPGDLEAAIAAYDGSIHTCSAPALSPDESAILRDVASGVQARLVGGGYATVTWPHATFFSGDRPNEPATLVTDLTGPARVIYYGPYFHLPAGQWTARVVLGFCKNAVGTPFSIEAHSRRLLGQGRVRPETAGVFSASFAVVVDEPQEPIEIRLASASGAIDGRVSLGKVEFSAARP